MTYSQAANLAVNQTLVRSINTSIIALLPIAAILFAGVGAARAGPLKDLALALFVGMAVGAYSSIFIATPLLADFKEREPAMQALAKRVAAPARRAGARHAVARVVGAATPAPADRRRRRRTPTDADDEPGRDDRGGGHRRRAPAGPPASSGRGQPAQPAAQAQRRTEQVQEAAMTEAADAGTDVRSAAARQGPRRPRLPASPGIVFKDITPLLADAGGVRARPSTRWRRRSGAAAVDKVAGIEARGFILGAPGRASARRRLRPGPQEGQAAR